MILQGNNLIIKLGNTAISAAKSCSIDVKVDTIEVSSPTTGVWKTFLTKRKEWSVSCAHLITLAGWQTELLQVGNTVTLTMEARNGSEIYDFDGTTYATPESSGVLNPSAIYWCIPEQKFVCQQAGVINKFYSEWAYGEGGVTTPKEPYFAKVDRFNTYRNLATGYLYAYDPDSSIGWTALRSYTGTAIVESADVSARRGSLASGSFKFKGTGELSIVTPSLSS